MNCIACGAPLVAHRETVRYDDCGLPDVYLVDVEVRRCRACGEEEIVIPRMAELHRAIAEALALRPAPLNGTEIRFLRKFLGLSQRELASRMGLRQETISRYENDRERMGSPAERLLRLLVLWGSAGREQPPLLEIARESTRPSRAPIRLVRDQRGRWRPRAA